MPTPKRPHKTRDDYEIDEETGKTINPKTGKPDARMGTGFVGKNFGEVYNLMTPEEKKDYLEKKAAEREVKKLMHAKIEERANELTDDMMNAIKHLLTRKTAAGTLKVNAEDFKAVFDRTAGPPKQEVDVTSGGEALPALDLTKIKKIEQIELEPDEEIEIKKKD